MASGKRCPIFKLLDSWHFQFISLFLTQTTRCIKRSSASSIQFHFFAVSFHRSDKNAFGVEPSRRFADPSVCDFKAAGGVSAEHNVSRHTFSN